MPAPLSLDLRTRIIEACQEQDETQAEMAARFRVHQKTVEKLWRVWRPTGSCAPRPHAGPLGATPPAVARLGRRAQRPHAGRVGGAHARARRRPHQRPGPVALPAAARPAAGKKSLTASERDRAVVAAARRRWHRRQLARAGLVFVDECGVTTAP